MSFAQQQQQTVGGFTLPPATDSVFKDVGTNIQQTSAGQLDRRMTRYGFRPIWDIRDLPGQGFMDNEITAGTVRPFRLFQFPVTNDRGEQMLIDRFPDDQVQDMVNTVPFFIEFREIALLDNEDAARSIFEALANPNACSKYPYQLRNKCATCWLNYLRSPLASERLSPFLGSPYEEAVTASYNSLAANLEEALAEAERQIDEAESLIADSTSPKQTYVPNDIINIQHRHDDMPEYRRTTKSLSAESLAQALQSVGVMGPSGAGAVTPQVLEIIQQMQAELAELRAERDKVAAAPAAVTTEDDEVEVDIGLVPDPIEAVVEIPAKGKKK
jgi:hypothetical protein